MDTTIPAAASPLTHALVAGARRPAVVLAAFPTALYLGLEDHAAVLPIVASDALILPTALRLAIPGPLSWDVEPGDVVTVGEGVVTLGHQRARVVRSWRPRRVAAGSPSPARIDWSELVGEIGRGPGLTPRADDVVCGALLAARAWGLPLPQDLPLARTTSLSASLLVAASAGYAVASVVDHLTNVVAGSTSIDATRSAVLGIGHTSGAALLEGIDVVGTHHHRHTIANIPLPERISL